MANRDDSRTSSSSTTSKGRTQRGGNRKKKGPASVDRSALGEKTRVFQLAKMLEVPSKELVVKLNELGLVKVAQSTLTKAEAEQLLDALESAVGNPAATAGADSPGDTDGDEKIRRRVRKDVENEIHQIEEKVDAELESAAPEALLSNVEPEVTPAPENPGSIAYTPLFKPPSRAERRRASRVADAAVAPVPDSASDDSAAADTADRVDGAGEAQGEDVEVIQEPKAIKGSSRLEAQRRRRTERREEGRKRSRIVSQAEFLARRESVERTMVVRERDRHDGPGRITQVGVLEDGLLVEHFVTSDQNASMIGNIYLGRVQNVLPSMEAAFIDIGQGRNGVLYAGEVDWKAAGLGGRSRRIEQALKSGDQVVVQVTKDPIGHKGARLTTQISLAGRYLVYVPGGRSAGISRKLPAPERKRLKEILAKVVPGKGGAIIRTAAENVPEEAIAADVNRLHNQWESIQEQASREKKSKGAKPVTLYEEPNLLVKVVRDLFNDDFTSLVVDGKRPWNVVHAYVSSVAPDLEDRLQRYDRGANDGRDAFETYRVDEQIQKALARTVWLPSGGTLVIDRTEAMTVIDVNTGKFTGSGGSLEETVTRNNLEAAEEIVRQMRLRDLGGMIIVDFIDMILPENQELVLRRLKEALGRDRTRHEVSEVTSLGLVQMTRKRLGTGLLDTFSTPCECCGGRGIILSDDPVDADTDTPSRTERSGKGRGRDRDDNREQSERPTTKQEEKKRKADIALDDAALQELADSVLSVSTDEVEDSTETGTDSFTDTDSGEDSRGRGRRRGRRGGSRGRGKETTPTERTEKAEPNHKEAAAETGDSDEQNQAYAEALAEFEASPRRRRRTRGNSRSDHAPRREDYADSAEQSESAESAESAETAGQSKPAAAKAAPPSGRRGRRRAVRRATSDAPDKQEAEKQNSAKKGAANRKAADTATSRGRNRSGGEGGRRRATRRRSS